MAVGRGLGDEFGTDRAACAGLVVDHDRLTEQLLQPFGEQARVGVQRTAGRKTDDQANRAFGEGRLRGHGGAEQPHGGQQRGQGGAPSLAQTPMSDDPWRIWALESVSAVRARCHGTIRALGRAK